MTLAEALAAALADPDQVASIQEPGARTCLAGRTYDPEDGPRGTKTRVLPAGGPDRANVRLSPSQVAPFITAAEAGDWPAAAEAFLDVFDESFGFWPVVVDVTDLWLWPDDGSATR